MVTEKNKLRSQNLKLFIEYLLLGLFSYFYLNAAKPFTNVLIYQGRDILRAAAIVNEGKVFWFGPELYGGGFLPGSFYYYLISIPIWLTHSLYSVIDLQHLMITFAVLFGFYSVKKLTDLTTAFWFVCFFLTIPYTFEFFLQFDNPSFLYPFLTVIFYLLYLPSLNNKQFFLFGFLFSLAAQLHGSTTLLFLFVLLISRYLWQASRKSVFLMISGYLSTQIPYFIWRLFYFQNEWGSLSSSITSIYEDSFQVYSNWLKENNFLHQFKLNLFENLRDHFFWSPTSVIFMSMLAVGFLLFWVKKDRLKLHNRILKSGGVTLLTAVPAYFYLIANPGERPRYALLMVFSALYLFLFMFFEFKKNKLTEKIMSAIGIILLIYFSLSTELVISSFKISVPLIIFIIGIFFKEIKNTKALLLPISTLFLVTNLNLEELNSHMISNNRKIVSLAENSFKIQCPQKVRIVHERGIFDIREFLTISIMEDLSQDIFTLTNWSPEYLNQHTSLMGVNESNEFFSVYKNIYEQNISRSNPALRQQEGLLFIFNTTHLCLQKRNQDIEQLVKTDFVMDRIDLKLNKKEFVNSFYDIDKFIKNKILESTSEIKISGPFVLIYTKKLEGYEKINNIGFPYRYPNELEISDRFPQNETAKSGFRSRTDASGFFFTNDCSQIRDFCLTVLDIENKNGKIFFEAKGQSISQPTKNSMPGFIQKWIAPSLILTCADGSNYTYQLAETIGNEEFQNYLLGPLRGNFKNPCVRIKNINLVTTRMLRRFEKTETNQLSLWTGDFPF